ncbi:AraC family transcriptional regulator [uncultured Phocaeicola sp.]|uniref:AraC family transcriptional regulator n=1 Tax=uncultured Phocaeicola sp. TaxID=990718 RepID=UPI0025A5F9BE|nr:AraC family transcriptional regulator [uncultured Phocaeicola sp.]
MKRAIPLYTFYKHKYGSELLIDIVELKNIKKFIAGKQAHTLSYYDITFITEGEGAFSIGNQTHHAVPKDVFFSKPGEIRNWDIHHIDNGFALIFEEEFLSSFFKDSLFVQHLAFFQPGTTSAKLHLPEALYVRFLSLLQNIKKEIDAYQSNDVHVLRALLYEALMLLNRAYQSLPADDKQNETGNPYIGRFIRLVDEYAECEHSVQFYAEQLCITPNYLNELVSTTLNISVKQYIRNKIMERAKNLLVYTRQPISEIAETLHFSTVSYFVRSFRQHTGTTPLLYRMGHQP